MAVIEAYVTNLGKYNEGELASALLKFPTTREAVQEVLKQIGIDNIRYEEIFIADYDGDLSELNACLGEYESIDELNHLACLLSELDKSDLEKFEAVVASGEHTSGAGDLINLAENLDCYDFYIGVSDDETLGRIYAEDMEMIDIPENLRNYFDYEAYGRDMRINEDGSFVKGGFLLPNGSQFIEYYHGREDIPTNTRFLPIHSSPSGNRWQLIKKSLTVFPRRRNAHTRSKAIQTDSGTSGHFVQRCFFLERRDQADRRGRFQTHHSGIDQGKQTHGAGACLCAGSDCPEDWQTPPGQTDTPRQADGAPAHGPRGRHKQY